MSRINLEKSNSSVRNSADRILMSLKMHGAMTSTQMGEKLKTTGEAARQHLTKLAEEGLVGEERRAAGRGRPSVYWYLTQAGHDRFPNAHADLAVDVLASVEQALGQEALDTIIGLREARTRDRYQGELAGRSSLKERVEKLAELRSAEGYMAATEMGEDGSLMLIENHCPICTAARFCKGFCQSELEVFRSILGPTAHIERIEHILGDAQRCVYRISDTAPTEA
ncbi:transcriptional regulator [Cohaesibacter sp. ES.047]|uniref:helix-turn-helix transcriptional regulator n=1 Tax=Cohaesibacter sp. ES.047 TaxID=1798205 RepID=UPI000BC07EB1|nr:metalloregulator ArsR/SmtB family transcription factor [Cohaesibacter sp. ES.047]SNY90556.1 transcriptional regulator [Cohaesibacter sp. ES.047]